VNVPYTTARRSDTGVNNVTLGMWLFIASEVMLFGALFSSYALLRASATDWPSGPQTLSLLYGLINSVVLAALTSVVWRARSRSPQAARPLLLLANSLGSIFLIVKSLEYQHDITANLLPHVNTFLAMYFTLTGLHAAHVIAGVAANFWVVKGRVDDAMFAGRVRALALYWIFVDIVWLIIFIFMYLL